MADLQPGSQPPPPPPAYAPPPKKSGALKWILIGCGVLTGLGILVCAGGSVLLFYIAKKGINEAVARVKPLVESNEQVKAEIGEVKSVTPRLEMKSEKVGGRETARFTLDVVGERGKGTVLVDLTSEKDKELVFVTLTFKSEQGRTVHLGRWEGTQDGRWTPTGEEPTEEEPIED